MGSALPMLGLPSRADVYGAALEGLVRVNELILDKNPGLPPLYAAGVRWRNIPHEKWRRADTIAREGWGDCEGISGWRAAELRLGRGVCPVTGAPDYDPAARVNCYHTGPKKYHAVVMRGNDMIEDPSIMLGMRVRHGMPRTREEMNILNGMWPTRPAALLQGYRRPTVACVAGDAEWSEGITTEFVPQPDGTTTAQIKIPLPDGNQIVANTSPIKWDGLLRRPAEFLERPENTAAIAKLGPWGKVAAEIIKNPLARQAREVTHDLLRRLPGPLGRLF